MATAIDFAVRSAAGGTTYSTVAGPDQTNYVQVAPGDTISLNLSRESILSYQNVEGDLVMELADGRTIVLVDYFDAGGAIPQQLFLSSNGELSEVLLQDNGQGVLFADYGPVSTGGMDKWSPLDGLRFADADGVVDGAAVSNEPAGMGIFAPALLGAGAGGAGLGAAALVGGGLIATGLAAGGGSGNGGTDDGDDGTDGGTRPAPTVNGTGTTTTLTTNTASPEIDVTGTGVSGDRVTVTVGGKTETTTVGTDGKWSVVFDSTELPADGDYTAKVVVLTTSGATVNLTGPGYVIDMTPPDLDVTAGLQSTGDVENLAEYADGITLNGTAEAGSQVSVTISGVTHSVTANASGAWSVNFTQTEIAGGERSLAVVMTATDIHGNVTTLNDTLVLDTIPNALTYNRVTADNTISSSEIGSPIVLTGSSTAGATVTITLGGVSRTVTAGADGAWSASWAAGTLAAGEYDATATAVTVDAAGNTTTSSHTFRVDTVSAVAFSGSVAGDNMVNAAEAAAGVTLTGTSQAGSTVTVIWSGRTIAATVAADGSWSAFFPSSAISTGTYGTSATVVAMDAFGNTSSATRAIAVDTQMSAAFNATQMTDNAINAAERTAGVTLTGTAEAGSTVRVTFMGVTRTVTATGGAWSAAFTAAEIPAGTYSATASIVARDLAGNEVSSSKSVYVDTEVAVARSTLSTGADNILNAAEAASGLTVTGSGEVGATISVRLGSGAAITTTVGANGTWSATIPAAQIPAGENTRTLAITATDAYGNTQTVTETVNIDTTVRNFVPSSATITSDGALNAAETLAGLTMSGTAEPGSTITLTLSTGGSHTVISDAKGHWTTTFTSAELPTGEGTASVTVVATDLAGNHSTFTQNFVYDTVAPETPEVTAIGKDASGLYEISTAESADAYSFHRVDATGAATELTGVVETNRPTRHWDTFDLGTSVPDGSYLVIDTADAAGNQTSTLFISNNTNSVTVDLTREGLTGFDLSAVDLTQAPQAHLTITENQLLSLTGNDHTLTIKGDDQDQVTMVGATQVGAPVTDSDGQTYAIYALGTHGGLVRVDDDIIVRTTI